jgi:hypothetical protein
LPFRLAGLFDDAVGFACERSFIGCESVGFQHEGVRGHADLLQHGWNVEQPFLVELRGVELQTADHPDGFRPAAQFAQPGGIRFDLERVNKVYPGVTVETVHGGVIPCGYTHDPLAVETLMTITALDLAQRYIGIREIAGQKNHPLVSWWLSLCGFDLSTALVPFDPDAPAVAFNGTQYLVVWRDGGPPSGIYGTRVSTAGAMAQPTRQPVTL